MDRFVNGDFARDVVAMQLEVRDFMRDCESMTVGMVKRIDDDGNAILDENEAGESSSSRGENRTRRQAAWLSSPPTQEFDRCSELPTGCTDHVRTQSSGH